MDSRLTVAPRREYQSFHDLPIVLGGDHGLVDKGRVMGMDIIEIAPKRDLNGITAVTAGRFVRNLIGMAVRAGYFD